MADPSKSMNELAKMRGVSRKTVSRAVNRDLGMKSFVKRPRNILTERSKGIRQERCPKLLNHLKNRGGHVRIFVDEKKFDVDQANNRQNCRFIAKTPSEVPAVMRSKNPASVMVFGAVASDGRVMPPHFIQKGLKINSAEYLRILDEVLMPWVKKHYDPKKVIFVQDSAPAHGSKTVQEHLGEIMPLFVPKHVWPSSSPDLNPCDYWLWSVVEAVSNAKPHSSIASLQAAIKRGMRSIKPEEAVRACASFRNRIGGVIEAKGGHIE